MANASSSQWTSEAEAGVRQHFEPWLAVSNDGAVPRSELRKVLHQLQPSFGNSDLDDILSCGDCGNAGDTLIDLRRFLDWIFTPADGETPKSLWRAQAKASLLAGRPAPPLPMQEGSYSDVEPHQVARAITDSYTFGRFATIGDCDELYSSEAPSLSRAVSAAPERLRRVPGAVGSRGQQPTGSRRASRGQLARAQELFRQRLGAGAVAMTDQMLLRLTRATSSNKHFEAFVDVPVAAPVVDVAPTAEEVVMRFGEGAGASPPLSTGSCGICFEEGVEVGSLCGLSSCSDRFCADCMRRLAETFVAGAFYAMPWLKCPGCAARVPTGSWLGMVSSEEQTRYMSNGEALLTYRCPDCHSVGTLFQKEHDSDDKLSAESELTSHLDGEVARAGLDHMWPRFWRAEESAEKFAMAILEFLETHLKLPEDADAAAEDLGVPPPKLRWAQGRLLNLIEDAERRCCLHLALLRTFPKVQTPCCSAPMCFKCKISGWHPEQTCEERQRQEMSKDVQFCPKCGVPTVKSEGCDHIICVCGESWQWQDNPVANAIQTARTEVVQEMLDGGFDINTALEDETGETLLHFAARFRVLTMVTFLLERSADPSVSTSGGTSILMEALSDTHADGTIPVVEALLAARADVNARADYVSNSLFWVLENWERYYSEGEHARATREEREKGVPLVKLLLGARVDVNVRQYPPNAWDEEYPEEYCVEEDEEEEKSTDQEDDEEDEEAPSAVTAPEAADEAESSDTARKLAASEADEDPDEAPEKEKENDAESHTGPTALLLAVQRRLPLIASTIIQEGSFNPGGLDTDDGHGNRPLYLSVANRNMELVQELLAAGASVNAAGPEGTPPLHESLRAGHEAMAKVLLEAKADANAVDDEGSNALHCILEAAKKFDGEKLEVCSTLASSLAAQVSDVNLPTHGGETPLAIAAAGGLANVAEELLRYRAEVDHAARGHTALALAAEAGQFKCVELLLEWQAAVEARNEKQWTPLHRLAANWQQRKAEHISETPANPPSRVAALNALLEAKANADAVANDGQTPLLVAVVPGTDVPRSAQKPSEEQLEVIDCLLNQRADVNKGAVDGSTPLLVTCRYDGVVIVPKLLAARADPNITDSSSGSSLLSSMLARATSLDDGQGYFAEIAVALIQSRAEVNAVDRDGRTPVIALVSGVVASPGKLHASHMSNFLAQLAEQKCDMGLAPPGQQTPLQLAAVAGHVSVVEALLTNGAPVNGADSTGATALLSLCSNLNQTAKTVAAAGGSLSSTSSVEAALGLLLEKLLEARADVLVAAENGTTPLAAVLNSGPPLAMTLLLRAVPAKTELRGEHWGLSVRRLVADICSPHGRQILEVLELLVPMVSAADMTSSDGESLLDVLLSHLLFSAPILLQVRGAAIQGFNEDYRYDRCHNDRPLYKSEAGAIIYFNGYWKMNLSDKTNQWFYSHTVDHKTHLPPAGRWTTNGWRSQYRTADHTCPNIHLVRDASQTLRSCAETALACYELIARHGAAQQLGDSSYPPGSVLRVSVQTSAAWSAQRSLSRLKARAGLARLLSSTGSCLSSVGPGHEWLSAAMNAICQLAGAEVSEALHKVWAGQQLASSCDAFAPRLVPIEDLLDGGNLVDGVLGAAEGDATKVATLYSYFEYVASTEAAQRFLEDPDAADVHEWIRSVCISRGLAPAAVGQDAIRAVSLAEVCRVIDLGLAGQAKLRCRWLSWLFGSLACPDACDESGTSPTHLALSCSRLAVQDAALPLLLRCSSRERTDVHGRSLLDLLRVRASALLASIEEHALAGNSAEACKAARWLSARWEVARSNPLPNSSVETPEALATAIAAVEGCWRVTLLLECKRYTLVWDPEFFRKHRSAVQGRGALSDTAAPKLLRVRSPNGWWEAEGEYVLDADHTGNGQPVWRKREGMCYWLYSGKSGKWHLGSNECRKLNFNCDKAFLYRNMVHNSIMPHKIGGCWRRWDGVAKKWIDDKDIKFSNCPAVLAAGISSLLAAEEAVWRLSLQELWEIGQLEMPPRHVILAMRAALIVLQPEVSLDDIRSRIATRLDEALVSGSLDTAVNAVASGDVTLRISTMLDDALASGGLAAAVETVARAGGAAGDAGAAAAELADEWRASREHLRDWASARQFLARLRQFQTWETISDTQALQLNTLLSDRSLTVEAALGAGDQVCGAICTWARAIGQWHRTSKEVGQQLAQQHATVAMHDHMASGLKGYSEVELLEIRLHEGPRPPEEEEAALPADDDLIVRSLRTLMAAVRV